MLLCLSVVLLLFCLAFLSISWSDCSCITGLKSKLIFLETIFVVVVNCVVLESLGLYVYISCCTCNVYMYT